MSKTAKTRTPKVLRFPFPTVGTRMHRAMNVITVVKHALSSTELDEFDVPALKASLQAAYEDLFWVAELGDGLLTQPAPSEDERAAVEHASA